MDYSLPVLIVFAAYLCIAFYLGQLRPLPDTSAPLLLAIPLGTGFIIALLLILAALAQLNPLAILLSLAVALAAKFAYLRQTRGSYSPGGAISSWGLLLACVLVAIPSLLLGMKPPHAWDELSYHLPYARDYALAGELVVSEHLRFPLHAHNFNLLYAATLLFAPEVTTHLLQVCAGLLVTLGIYCYSREFGLGRGTGTIAALLYLVFIDRYLDTAYVDLGMGMFVFFAFFSFQLWRKYSENRFLYIAAALLGLAAGTKYQGLMQLPAFGLMLLFATRSPVKILSTIAVFTLFAAPWYLRSFLISGDPVHPMGAEFFGYWIWDEADLAGQMADVSKIEDMLPIELWPSLAAVLFLRRSDPAHGNLVLIGLIGLGLWFFTSQYDRYLLPLYPFLALLSIDSLWRIMRAALGAERSEALISCLGRPGAQRGLWVLLGVSSIALSASRLDNACFTRHCVEDYYAGRLASYGAIQYLENREDLRLYQFGLENEIYHLGPGVYGDVFGSYRYREILRRNGDGEAIGEFIEGIGANSILLNKQRSPFNGLKTGGSFAAVFETLYEDDKVVLYRLKDS